MGIFLKLTTIALITPSLFTVFSPQPVKAGNQFDVCLKRLIDSGVAVDSAKTGCAGALLPRDLSSCVSNITRNTDINAMDALQNCYRVRSPIEMGDCVVSINKNSISKYSQSMIKSSESETDKTEETETESTNSDISMTDNSLMDNQESPLMLALTTCRESLFPARHSECVITLSRNSENTSPTEAMTICIKAEDFPRDIFPAY